MAHGCVRCFASMSRATRTRSMPGCWSAAFSRVTRMRTSACTRFNRAAELDPQNVEAVDQHATLLTESGKGAEALAVLERATEGGGPIELQGRLAWVRNRLGDHELALAAVRELLQREPHYRFGWGVLFDCLTSLERSDDLLAAFREALQVMPDELDLLERIAQLELKEGRPDRAREALQGLSHGLRAGSRLSTR